MEEKFLVIMCADRKTAGSLRQQGGANLIVDTDKNMSSFVNLYFRNLDVLKKATKHFLSKGYRLNSVIGLPYWICAGRESMNVETFLAQLPDLLHELGFQVFIAKMYDQRVDEES